MTFLNPAVLFGLAAASIPVLIHILNLRRLKRIEFSTLKFLKELQKNKIRKIKLKQWLLLALRVMIILFLVTAFARPTLEGLSIGGTTSAAKTTAIFILDDTYSMSVVDQNGSYFNQAKQKIKQLLNQLEEGDEAGIILVSNGEEEVKLTTNIASVSEEVNKLLISDASRNLHNAFVKVAEVMAESKNFNKEIYLLTDFQKNRIAEEKQLSDLSELLNEQVRLYSFNFSGSDVYNIAIDDITVNTQIFEQGKPVKYEVVVSNYSDLQAENLVVSLFVDGERSVQKSINLDAGESKKVEMEAPVNTSGIIEVFAEIEEDDILLDNRRYTSINIPETIPVLILTEKLSDAKFVELALSSSRTKKSFEITAKEIKQLPATSLNDFEVLVIISSNLSAGKEKLKEFLTKGNGAIIFPSAKEDLSGFNSLLKSIELPKSTGYISVENKNQAVEFDQVEFIHPLFEQIFLDEEKKEIESPLINKYYKLNMDGKGKRIITLIDGSSFLSEYKINGTVLLFNSSPVLFWSDFPIKSIFAPLLNKMIFYLAAKDRNEVEVIAGEKLSVNISEQSFPQVKVVMPDKREELINFKEQLSTDFLYFSDANLAGHYKILFGEKLVDIISVNTNPIESNIDYITAREFDEYLKKINFKGAHLTIEIDENPAEVIMQARFGSELWRYFLIAALILVLIEMAVARNAKKELVDVENK
jgi:uncharacterized repeat protein (TIGR01451 family)